jgi:hypothetical protein
MLPKVYQIFGGCTISKWDLLSRIYRGSFFFPRKLQVCPRGVRSVGAVFGLLSASLGVAAAEDLSLAGAQTALPQVEEFTGPLSQPEHFSARTVWGPGISIHSFECYQHILSPRKVIREGAEELLALEEGVPQQEKAKVYFPVSWNLQFGLGFLQSQGRFTDPVIWDRLIFYGAGLDWWSSPTFRVSADLQVSWIDAESYNQGGGVIQVWKVFPSADRSPERAPASQVDSVVFDDSEAATFYAQKWQEKENQRKAKILARKGRSLASGAPFFAADQSLGSDWTVGLIFGALSHVLEAKMSRSPSIGVLPARVMFSQSQIGIELQKGFSPEHRWRARVTFFPYVGGRALFSKALELSGRQRLPLLGKTGWDPATNQLFSFPAWSFDQGFLFSTFGNHQWELSLNEMLFEDPLQGLLLAASLRYHRIVSQGWNFSVIPHVAYQLSSGFWGGVQVQINYLPH